MNYFLTKAIFYLFWIKEFLFPSAPPLKNYPDQVGVCHKPSIRDRALYSMIKFSMNQMDKRLASKLPSSLFLDDHEKDKKSKEIVFRKLASMLDARLGSISKRNALAQFGPDHADCTLRFFRLQADKYGVLESQVEHAYVTTNPNHKRLLIYM